MARKDTTNDQLRAAIDRHGLQSVIERLADIMGSFAREYETTADQADRGSLERDTAKHHAQRCRHWESKLDSII